MSSVAVTLITPVSVRGRGLERDAPPAPAFDADDRALGRDPRRAEHAVDALENGVAVGAVDDGVVVHGERELGAAR
jgi:hypothetical protein